MKEFLSLSCPSCGGRLKQSEQPACFTCDHCESEYLLRQSGESITLHRISENVLHVGSSSTVVQARTVIMGNHPTRDSQQYVGTEVVECPICGKQINRNETFRCKKCKRDNICLSHQDDRSYACSDCGQKVADGLKQRPSYWIAIGLNLLFGFGLFYIDKKNKRKWFYPTSIIIFFLLGFWGTGHPLPLSISFLFYIMSFVEVIVICARKRKAITEQFI